MSGEASHLTVELSPETRAEWAAELARAPEAAGQKSDRKLFLFRLGAEWFGLDPVIFAATLPDSRSRRIPHRRSVAVDGLVVFDGRVVVCLALDRFFKILPVASDQGIRRLLVLNWHGWVFAIRADEAVGVEEIDDSKISPLSQTASDLMRRCASGVLLHRGIALTCLEAGQLMKELEGVLQ